MADDWPRAWKYIEPLFADCDPKTVTPEMLLALRSNIAPTVSAGEAYRVIKVWRALWKKMATFGYCTLNADPGKAFVRGRAPWRRRKGVGPTVFDWLVEIINDSEHKHGVKLVLD